ncbi:MAG: GNAT family N-acetyltransferase [Chloroflexi bacterium]|nr:GNAT family N-acetyltransferase [Chloroflexota bacterium]OJV99235.1 MAG: hypothetical protein BGO39_17400 [Chloroflexi bacterium 54-19]
MNDFELTDGELILRPFKLEYAEAHLAGDDAENVHWLSGGVSTIETVRNWIIRNQQAWEEGGPVYSFAIFDAKTGQQVGMIDGNANPAQVEGLEEGDINISYNIYPSARGKGYATRAVNLIQPFFKEKGYKTAIIRVHPDNAKSLGVAERANFTRVSETVNRSEGTLIKFKKLISLE